MSFHQRSMSGDKHPVFGYKNKWSYFCALVASIIIALWTLGFAQYKTDPGVLKHEGIVADASCGGARRQKTVKIEGEDGYVFYVLVGVCDSFESATLVGLPFVSYYYDSNPEQPIEVKVGSDFGYNEGWTNSDVVSAIIFTLFGGYLGFMFHCLYRKRKLEKAQ